MTGHRNRYRRGGFGCLPHWGELAGIWRHPDARMLCRIPEFEQPTAEKLFGAARNFVRRFHFFLQHRRIGELHLHSRDRRHREITAIESGRNQRQRVRLSREIDRKPVASRQLFV